MESLRTHVAKLIANNSPTLSTNFTQYFRKPSSSSLETIVCFSKSFFMIKKDLKISRRFFDASTSINWYFIDFGKPSSKAYSKMLK